MAHARSIYRFGQGKAQPFFGATDQLIMQHICLNGFSHKAIIQGIQLHFSAIKTSSGGLKTRGTETVLPNPRPTIIFVPLSSYKPAV